MGISDSRNGTYVWVEGNNWHGVLLGQVMFGRWADVFVRFVDAVDAKGNADGHYNEGSLTVASPVELAQYRCTGVPPTLKDREWGLDV